MHYIKIAGAATLTGVGLGCLATDAVLRQRSGEDLTLVARTLRAPSAQRPPAVSYTNQPQVTPNRVGDRR